MGKTLEINDVPDVVHDSLAVKASAQGLSLSAYVLGELQRIAKKPHPWEMTSADIIRELRGPLPDDDPEYQRFLAIGGDTVHTPEQAAAQEVWRELVARRGTMTNAETLDFLARFWATKETPSA
jgi:hypothetical protein